MANLKFSGFTAAAAIDQTDSFLVGFDTDGGGANPTNNKWTFPEVAVGLAAVTATPYSIYAGDGTIGTTRKALITDTIQFRNAGDTSDVLSLNTDGTFGLGVGAVSGGANAVSIGNIANAVQNGIAIGHSAGAAQGNTVSIGGFSSIAAGATQGVAIGYDVDLAAAAVNSIGLGSSINASGANSVTFNASTGVVSPSTANAFGVYMTSNTTPDFEVVGSGESTLNTSLKITGQGYTELHANATNLVVSWNDSNIQTVTVNTSVPVFAPTNPKAGATYILIITQGATPVTVDWNSLVKWPGGTAPTLSSVTSKIDVITLICYDDSTTNGLYYGSATLDLA